MNKIRNHSIGAAITAAALAAVMLTGCGNGNDECNEADSSSMFLVARPGGGSGGGKGGSSGSRGGGFSKPKQNSPKGGSSGNAKVKPGNVHVDDCDDDTEAMSLAAYSDPRETARKASTAFDAARHPKTATRFYPKPGDRPGDRMPKNPAR